MNIIRNFKKENEEFREDELIKKILITFTLNVRIYTHKAGLKRRVPIIKLKKRKNS